MSHPAPALTLMLFDLDDPLAPGAGDRCGRHATTTGGPCQAYPRRGAPACAFHITAEELAVCEQSLRPRAVA